MAGGQRAWRILATHSFPEPCGHSGLQPSPKQLNGGRCELLRFQQWIRRSIEPGACARGPVRMSRMPIVVDYDNREES
jgi:hypothetical protein